MATTVGTILKWGDTLAYVAKVTPIKSYPDLIQAPDALENTDLEAARQTFEEGILKSGIMSFTANYDSDVYDDCVTDASTDLWYQLDLGTQGSFIWQGTHNVMVPGFGVNSVREFSIHIAPSTPVTKVPNLLTVAIPGTPQQGVATGALTKTYTQTPLDTPTFTYIWKIASTSGGTYTNITGATSATYTPVEDDVDKYLKCEVTASVYANKTVLSTASAKIIAA